MAYNAPVLGGTVSRAAIWAALAGGGVFAALTVAVGGGSGPALGLPAAPGVLRYVSGPEPETLDPALATALIEVRLLAALFEGLVRVDPMTGEVVGAAATGWDVLDGGRTYVFRLREGLAWSNGDPLGAADFAYAWARARDPATRAPNADLLAPIEAAEAEDGGRTLRVRLASPRPDFPALLTLPVFLPVHRTSVELHGADRFTRPGNLVSNGPFRLVAWQVNRGLRLERSERWHGAAGVELKTIEASTVASGPSGFNLYETGAADLVFDVPSHVVPYVRGRADFVGGPRLGTYFVRMNTTRPPLDDARVRRALALAIDRDAICERITRGGERPAATFVPPGLPGYEGPGAHALAYDPGRARAQLDAAGYPSGAGLREIEYLYDGDLHGAIGEALEAAWRKELGVRIRLRKMERKVALGAVRRLEYDLARSSWVADYPDARNFLGIFRAESGNNRTGFRDARFEELLEAEDLPAAEARLLEAAPIAPIFFYANADLIAPRLRGFVPNPLNLVVWQDLRTDP